MNYWCQIQEKDIFLSLTKLIFLQRQFLHLTNKEDTIAYAQMALKPEMEALVQGVASV